MNNTIKLLKNHRSNRNFEENFKIKKETILEIIKATKQTPSWMNGQHYSIIVVDDKKLKEKIYELSPNNKHIKTSSVFFIFLMDMTKQQVSSKIHNKEFVIEKNTNAFLNSYTDTVLAMQNAAIASESLGYGTVFCGGVRNIAKELIELFNLPKYVFPICGLSVGKLDLKLTTEKIKPRFSIENNIGFNEYSSIKEEDIYIYDEILKKFGEKRETKLWSVKFSDLYAENNSQKLDETLKKQGYNL